MTRKPRAPKASKWRTDSNSRGGEMSEQPALSVTQIAEALAGERPLGEIVNTIAAHRPSIDIDELAHLLDRAKELQAQAEELQRKASILMDVVGEIVKTS